MWIYSEMAAVLESAQSLPYSHVKLSPLGWNLGWTRLPEQLLVASLRPELLTGWHLGSKKTARLMMVSL